jgi:hypothetical protein
MKKNILILASCLIASTALSQYKIDLKTPAGDKEKLRLAKAGLGSYLRQAEWAKVVNVGEDYSVWIKNLNRKFKGNVLYFDVTLEVRTTADVGSGTLLNGRTIRDTIDLSAIGTTTTFEDREIIREVEKQIQKNNKYKPIPVVLGTVTGVPIAGPIVEKGLKFLGVDLEAKVTPDQAVESMVLGAVLIANLREMIDELSRLKESE